MDEKRPIQRRRRGRLLEDGLLDAAWAELRESGFAALTMETVAARARTGTAVLYRRWGNKSELVLAAIERYRETHPVVLSDTGTLRGDLIAALTAMGDARAPLFAVVVAASFSGLLAASGLTPAQLRERVIGELGVARVRAIYERAHARSEIDLRRLSPAVLAMPFDLVRNDLFMKLGPVKPARIRAIVDDLFVPLARTQSRAGRRATANARG